MNAFASAAGTPLINGKALVECVRTDFGVALSSLSQVLGGQDSEAALIHAATVDGTSVAVKVSRNMSITGLLVSAFLARRVSSGIPAPLEARSGGEPYSIFGGRRVSLTPWIPGRGAYETGMDAHQWLSFGALLSEVHAAQVPPAIADHLPGEDYRTPAAAIARRLAERVHAQESRSCPARAGDSVASALIREWSAAVIPSP